MPNNTMHDNEIVIDVSLVRKLLSEQFPKWASLPITPVQSAGTDNAIYRLGVDMCVRLPRIPEAAKDIEKEHKWLPEFAAMLPLDIPIPLGMGSPNEHYPLCWSIYHWLEGNNVSIEPITDLRQAAIDLAKFVNALQKINPVGGPTSRRGVPLVTQDIETRHAIKLLNGRIDTAAATNAWDKCLQAPEWNKSPVWTHGDLLPANLLVQNGKLSAVIDFGLLGVGDPACDVIAAWSIFTSSTRDIFRSALAIDDATWMRGRGWALSIALIILPYYWNTNPGLVAVGKRMLNEVLSDF